MRVTGFLLVVPILSSSYIPTVIKIVTAMVISFFIYPLVDVPTNVDPVSFSGLYTIAQQIFIGVILGTILQFVFNAIIIAGENIALTMGLGFAQLSDPVNGVNIPVISQALTIFASLYFLALNGHIALIQLLVDSFTVLPITSAMSMDTIVAVLDWSSRMFIGAVMISIPAVTALLIINIAMGLMTRVAPQMNIFSVGLPVTLGLGFIFILATLPVILRVFQNMLNDAFATILQVL
jgi:flagellar biosynthetic protein FliR